MFDVNPTLLVLYLFSNELTKEAALVDTVRGAVRGARLHGMGAGAGSGLGLGLGAGLVGGGLLGGVRSYRQAREQGAGRAAALGSALGGTTRGALQGGAAGAVLGAGGGALLGQAAPTKVLSATKGLAKRQDTLGSFSRFGQRQVHSLTGWKPGGSIKSVESIGAGAAPAREAVKGSLGALEQSPEMANLMAAHATKDPKAVEVAREALRAGPQAHLSDAYKALHSAETTQQMGLTSLPGYAKSVGRNGLLPTLKAGVKEQWQSSGPKGKMLMVGLPALSAAQALHQPEGAQKRGKGETIGRLAGSTLGSMAAPMSLAGGLVLGTGFEHAGGAIGKGVDRLRGKRAAQPAAVPQEPSRPPATEPGDTGQAAVERVYGTGYGGGAGGLE